MTDVIVPEAPPTGELTPARVAQLPLPGTNVPVSVRFSPDGKLITFLYSEEGTLTRQLWAFDPDTGVRRLLAQPAGEGVTDANVSREEALRRERQRVRGFGVTSYEWSRRGDALLVPVRGAIFGQNGLTGRLREVMPAEPPCIDPRLNHDGSAVAFVRGGELYALDLLLPDAVPTRLTFDASPVADGEQLVTNGLAEFVAQEEMDRSAGFWWSADGRFLAFEQVDSSPVLRYSIVHQAEDAYDVETHRYPFAGGPNVAVRLGVVRAAGGAVRWLPLDGVTGGDGYLTRVDWTPDGQLLLQVMPRNQRTLELRRVDLWSGTSTTLLSETAGDWINLHHDLRCTPLYDNDGSAPPDHYELLWSSEQSGVRQLYLCDREGNLLRQLTAGSWPVDGVVDVDDVRRVVYFAAAKSPLERHIWRVDLDRGEPERITREAGVHAAAFSPDHLRFVDSHSALDTPPTLALRSADGTQICSVFAESDPEVERFALRPPELVSVRARDGAELHGVIYRPPQMEPGRRYPVLVEVYGGPHVQVVVDSWGLTVNLRAQYLARQGFIVFALDNRGSSRRGHLFEEPIFRHLGGIEVQDQVDGVRCLASLPEADTARVGVYGWSYGGYLTLMCLLKAPDVFKAGVAGAPVTAWDGYDTFYTERYMDTPAANPEGYRESSALRHVGSLRGRLLMLQGMLDENVHFRHTARLIAALNEADKGYELALFPNERHGPRSPAQRAALERRLAEFFKAYV